MFWEPYLTSPIACTILTRLQSASSSSATIMGRHVRAPVPISDRCATIFTSPARFDAEIYARLPDLPHRRRSLASCGADAMGAESTNAPAEKMPLRKLRRESFDHLDHDFHSRSKLDRLSNPLVRAAAADVALHRLIDIRGP